MKNKAIFLDRDGTINIDTGYTHKIEDLMIIPKVVEGLKLLQSLGSKLIIITGQSGIGRGYYTEEDYHVFMDEMYSRLRKEGINFDGEYFCPHHPEKGIGKYKINCNCRKPKTGMLKQASNELNVDLSQSWMIGDKLSDIQAGNSAGCRTIYVLTGEYKESVEGAEFEAANLLEAANYILNHHTNK